MIMQSLLAQAIVGHMVGDYLLQNDWIAQNKKQQNLPCLIHCLLWSLSVMVFTGWWSWLVFSTLFISHFAQDRTQIIAWYMRKNNQSGFMTVPFLPWGPIIVDNTWHLVVLWAMDKFISYLI